MSSSEEALGQLSATVQSQGEYLNKALEQRANYNNKIVEKVCGELRDSISQAIVDGNPFEAEIRAELDQLATQKNDLLASNQEFDERMQELEFRKVIGIIDENSFANEVQALRESNSTFDVQLSQLDQRQSLLSDCVEQWTNAVEQVSPLLSDSVDDELVDESSESFIEEAEPSVESVLEEVAEVGEDAQPIEPNDPVLESFGESKEDSLENVNLSQDDSFSSDPIGDLADIDSIGGIEGLGDISLLNDDEENHSFDIGLEQFGIEDSAELSAELASPDDFSSSIEMNSAELIDGELLDDSNHRSAMLLQNEGTPDEVVYPFHGETYSIGRSESNDIQIKNDSKVSRKHCSLIRKGSQFFIQDHKSSNGTMVNGELCHQRPLIGGEQIKVGETTFRFRIQ